MCIARYSILALCVVCCPAVSVAQPLVFQRDDIDSFSGARGIAAGDFNGDGWIDFVTANNEPDGVSLIFAQRSRAVYGSTFHPLPGGPFDIITADFDRDGLSDVAVANADANQINFFSFKASGHTAWSMPGGANPRSLTSGDIDRDGHLDLIVTEYGAAKVTIHWGDGTGTFQSRPSISLPAIPNPQGVGVADFNLDGRPDIVTVSVGGVGAGVTIHFATASPGVFTRWDIQGTPQANVLTIGDFDKDGRPDIAAAGTATSDITTLVNTRAGWSIRTFASGGASPRGIVTADLNRDGALDLVTGARGTNTVVVIAGRGDGGFDAPRAFAAGTGSRAVAVGDFDHDGRVDIAAANEYAETVTILSNTTAFPPVGFKFRREVVGPGEDNSSGGSFIDVADFDHDGRVDAVFDDNGVNVRFGDGRMITPAAFPVVGLRAIDPNNDGHADIVAVTAGSGPSALSRIETLLNDGTGAFPVRHTISTALIGVRMELGDLDRDGRIDLVMTGRPDWEGQNRIDVFRGNGNGTFTWTRTIAAVESPFSLAIGDVDRDGDPDLVTTGRGVATRTAIVVTRLNDGGFNFSEPREVPVDAFVGMGAADLVDLNQDGWLDFAGAGSPVDHQSRIAVAVMLSNRFGFGPPAYLTTTETGLGVNVGDITMDGQLDIMTDDGVLFAGHGDGTFADEQLFDFYGSNPRFVDFNGDGLLDMVMSTGQASLELILNQAGAENTPPTVDLGQDFTIDYRYQFSDGELELWARAVDPDVHKPTFRWRLPDGTVRDTGSFPFLSPPHMDPGRHEFIVEVSDGRGGTASDSVFITVRPEKEIVLHVGVEFWSQPHNAWQIVDDPTAASGKALHDINAGQPKVTTPSASPASYVDVSFVATNTETYKLWVRLKADGNTFSNDSLWLQFSGAVDANGRSYAPGTTSGIEVVLEECSGCGLSGWGWRDEAWGRAGAMGLLTLKFAKNGWQTLRIQTREDGVSIDQLVLSSEKYRTTRPGTVKNDATILPGVFYW
jgi:hypothetical protein